MRFYCLIIFILLLMPAQAFAQLPTQIPGPADAGRIELKMRDMDDRMQPKKEIIDTTPIIQGEAPHGADQLRFVLKDVRISGATAYGPEQLAHIYAPYQGQTISLKKAWEFAANITRRYRQDGYFLSRAFVPAQDIDGGVIRIQVVEGYIGHVEVKGDIGKSYVTTMAAEKIQAEKPLSTAALESYLLRLNDLSGLEYRAVLSTSANPKNPSGAVDLMLEPRREDGIALIRFDNYASRYLGPHEVYAYYETSFAPLQTTGFSFLASVPPNELRNGGISHKINLTPALSFVLSGSLTDTDSGFTLSQYSLKSRSVSWEAGLSYAQLRQRDQNFVVTFSLGGQNTTSNLLGAPFTRDRVVAVRTGIAYDVIDNFYGQNIINLKFSHGINGLGASKEDAPLLSRAQAKPNFTKLEMTLARMQSLPYNFMLQGRVSGQIASGPLYSSEEFGYGGPGFGRAYDSSELIGDQGVAATIEVQYNGWKNGGYFNPAPYGFYDIGKVLNKDTGQPGRQSASSAGFGLRFETIKNISGDAGLAFPLTRPASTPIYGGNGKNPRFTFQLTRQF